MYRPGDCKQPKGDRIETNNHSDEGQGSADIYRSVLLPDRQRQQQASSSHHSERQCEKDLIQPTDPSDTKSVLESSHTASDTNLHSVEISREQPCGVVPPGRGFVSLSRDRYGLSATWKQTGSSYSISTAFRRASEHARKDKAPQSDVGSSSNSSRIVDIPKGFRRTGGNAELGEAQIILLGEVHIPRVRQKILEFIKTHAKDGDIVLVEGWWAKVPICYWLYKNSLRKYLSEDKPPELTQYIKLYGWDDMKALNKSVKELKKNFKCLKELCKLFVMRRNRQELIAVGRSLDPSEQRANLSDNCSQRQCEKDLISLLDQFYTGNDKDIEEINVKLSQKKNEYLTQSAESEKKFFDLCAERDKKMLKTIEEIRNTYPDSKIFVVSGADHFTGYVSFAIQENLESAIQKNLESAKNSKYLALEAFISFEQEKARKHTKSEPLRSLIQKRLEGQRYIGLELNCILTKYEIRKHIKSLLGIWW